ncbi:MAG: hypothetical protein CSB46_11360, partial [Micrococcales bacterium]
MPVVAGVVTGAVVLGAAGAVAMATLGGGGSGPAEVMPGNAFAAATVDLDPSLAQKAAFLRLRGLLPDSDGQDEQGQPNQVLCEVFLSELDCTGDLPWLGQEAGVAAWPSSDPQQAYTAAFIEVSDDQAALKAVTGAYPGATVRDGYLVVDLDDSVPSAAASAEAVEAHGTLAKASGYAADMKKLDLDGIGYGWLDLDTMGDLAKSSGALDDSSVPLDTENLNKLQGSLVGGIALRSDGLQVRALGLGLADDLVVDMGKASQVNELPADSWLAFGMSGLPAALTKAYQDDPTLGGADESLQSMADRYDLQLPQDVSRPLGNDLAFSVAGDTSAAEPSVQVRLAGADADLLNTIADDVLG